MSSAYDITPLSWARFTGSTAEAKGETFAAARSALGQVRIEGKPDIQEIRVAGDYAFCWNQTVLSMFASRKTIQRPSRSLRKTDNVGLARRWAGPP